MNLFPLKITSPDGDMFSESVQKISVRGTEGELAILAGHIPFVTYVVPCKAKITLENGDEKSAKIEGGTLSVSEEKVILLTGKVSWE